MDTLTPTPSEDLTGDGRMAEILVAARGVVAQKGFVLASMQDLARAAGMSAGNFYRYFPSKEALMQALVRRELTLIEQHFHAVMSAEDPVQLIVSILHAKLDEFDFDECAIWSEVMTWASRNDEMGKTYAGMLSTISGYLIQGFARVLGLSPAEAKQRFGGHADMIMMLVQSMHLHRSRYDGAASPGVAELAHRTLDLYLSEILQSGPDVAGALSRIPDHA